MLKELKAVINSEISVDQIYRSWVLDKMALADLIPQNLNFGGGFGLAGLLAILFPYFQKFIFYLFNVNLTETVSALFHESSILGKILGGNSVLGTTVGLVGAGAFVAFLQQVWDYAKDLYKEYFSISLEIPSHDSTYSDILEWIHEKQIKNTKKLSLQTGTRQTITGKWENRYDFTPAVGTHKFRFQGKKFCLERIRPEKGEESTVSLFRSENSVISAMGRDTSVFREMLAEVKKFKEIKNEGKTLIYTAWQGCWQNSGSGKRKRPLNSVILDDGIAEKILHDIQDFMDSAEWYTEFGVPYRRGYLLYGPPGTGKTSFISAVAGKFDLNVCIVNLSDKTLNDDGLNRLLIEAPENSLVLLEDVDAAFQTRDQDKPEEGKSEPTVISGGTTRLTFSGLLNALDGIASAEGRILFMTTNNVERLDPALIRPGRVDYRQYVGYATRHQLERMFRRFYRNATDEEVQRFVTRATGMSDTISLARLQGLFLRYKHNPAAIFDNVSQLLE